MHVFIKNIKQFKNRITIKKYMFLEKGFFLNDLKLFKKYFQKI